MERNPAPSSGARQVRLIRGTSTPWPSYDLALSRALLLGVAAGHEPETLRLFQPPPTVAFGRQDRLKAGYPTASMLARASGFAVADRLVGTRTLAYHEGVVITIHDVPEPAPQQTMADRYIESATVVAGALRSLGVDARIGEVPGEYSPGAYSVNARDDTKLATVAHHAVAGASMMWCAVVAEDAERLRDVLVDVNESVDFDWQPRRLGAVSEEAPGVTAGDVADALLQEWRERAEVVDGEVTQRTRHLARALEPEHRAPPHRAGSAGAAPPGGPV